MKGRQVKSQIDPVDHARAEANLACVLHWAGKTSEAGPLALRALPYHHSDARLWLIAGVYLHQSKGSAEALAHLNRAKQLSPNDPRIDQAIEAVRKE